MDDEPVCSKPLADRDSGEKCFKLDFEDETETKDGDRAGPNGPRQRTHIDSGMDESANQGLALSSRQHI